MRQKTKYLLILTISFWLGASGVSIAQNNGNINPVLQRQQKKQPNAKEQLAIKYYREKDYSKAAELFQQLYNSKPSNYYYNYYFNSLIYIKDYKRAERLVKQHRKLNPSNYRYLIDEAYIIDLSGNKKKSSRILNKIFDKLPTQRNQLLQITNSLQSKGYSDMAVKVFQKARNNAGNNNLYGFEIGDAYLYSGEYSKMFESYIDHLELVPSDLQRVKSKLQYVMRMDVNSNLSDMLKSKLLQRSQRNPENIQFAEMLMWFSLQTKDFDMAYRQARSYDLRFGNGDLNMLELANIAYTNSNYEVSAKAYAYVSDKKNETPYYQQSYVGYYLSEFKRVEENLNSEQSDFEELEKQGIEAINELGINNTTSDIIVNLADITAFKLSKYDDAKSMIELALANPSIEKKKEAALKIKLADILVADDKIWDATLLYSQVESDMKNEPIGHEAKLKNAKVFYYVGEFDWAATRLDVLKSATSKLISNDAIELSLFIKDMREEDTLGFILRKFAGADLYSYQGKYDSAMILLEKIEKESRGMVSNEYALYRKARLYIKLNHLDLADSTYNVLINSYPMSIKADNALYERAELLRALGNVEEAKKLYLIVMTDYPESIYAGKSRKKYRLLEE